MIDYLVIGQGICGTFLSYELQKANCSFMVIDDARPGTSSKIASGIVNPVTGRRIVKSWMIDELLTIVSDVYNEIGTALGIQCIHESEIIDFFPSPQMRLAFLSRYDEDRQYLFLPEEPRGWQEYFNYDFGYGSIQPCYLVNLDSLLRTVRKQLIKNGELKEDYFEEDKLTLRPDGVFYKGITARKVIFCDGIGSMESKYFKNLPFAENKGEALIVEIKNLPGETIFKKGLSIVPWKDGLFWVGSSHEWQFADDKPTAIFRDKTSAWLRSFCKLPFTVVDHVAAIRPATLERRPFVGVHPLYPQIAILNGMGTKGCSLAPCFARNLVNHLTRQTPIRPEVNVQRFSKVLQRIL